MSELFMHSLSHFENGNGWTGSLTEMCFEIEPPQGDEMRVVTWLGPFSREYAREIGEKIFRMTEEGRAEMMAWIVEQGEELNANPPYTPEQRRAYYQSLKD